MGVDAGVVVGNGVGVGAIVGMSVVEGVGVCACPGMGVGVGVEIVAGLGEELGVALGVGVGEVAGEDEDDLSAAYAPTMLPITITAKMITVIFLMPDFESIEFTCKIYSLNY